MLAQVNGMVRLFHINNTMIERIKCYFRKHDYTYDYETKRKQVFKCKKCSHKRWEYKKEYNEFSNDPVDWTQE